MKSKLTVLTNGIIYTVDGKEWEKNPVSSIAYDEAGVIYTVEENEIKDFIAHGAEVIDLKGSTVLPGFVDSHVHAPGTAYMELYEVDLNGIHTKQETLDKLRKFIEANHDMEAYFAGGFDMAIRDKMGNAPCAGWLDEVCADKPVTVKSSDQHSRWLNTKSMQLSGITEEASVEFGHIHRYEDDRLTGLFTDCKELPIMEPKYNRAQQLKAIKLFMNKMNSWGYTSIMSIAPLMLFDPERYMELESSGKLSLKINCAQMILPADVEGCIENLKQLRKEFTNSNVMISTGKFLVDGVLEGKTACLKEPYKSMNGNETGYCGKMNWDKDSLKNACIKLFEAGFQSHHHCIGDEAATSVLDAIEYAQCETGNTTLRNVITHLQVVDATDYVRFGKLGIIAAIQLFWHYKEPGWFENIDVAMLGKERAENEYPAKSLVENGAVLTDSGDYPVSPSNNPFHGIQAGVTRTIYDEESLVGDIYIGDRRRLLGENERLTLKQMIEAYTINGAYQLFRENEIGSLKKGKSADMIIIDKDIFSIDYMDIHNISVKATILDGRIVYGNI